MVTVATGPSTNFGLKKKVEEKWQKQRQLEAHGDYVTNSQLAYKYILASL